MKGKKAIKRIVLIIILLGVAFKIVSHLALRNPSKYRNTIWECEEADICLITDKNGVCYGKINTGTQSTYFNVIWGDYTCSFYEIETDENGCAVVTHTYEALPYRPYHWAYPTSGKQLLFASNYICMLKRIEITIDYERIGFEDGSKPTTLTFVCRGRLPEIDINFGVDPICRMEPVRSCFFGSGCSVEKAIRRILTPLMVYY